MLFSNMKRSFLTDTGENVQKWTRVFSTRRRASYSPLGGVGKKRKEKSVSTFGHFRLWTSFESISVNSPAPEPSTGSPARSAGSGENGDDEVRSIQKVDKGFFGAKNGNFS